MAMRKLLNAARHAYAARHASSLVTRNEIEVVNVYQEHIAHLIKSMNGSVVRAGISSADVDYREYEMPDRSIVTTEFHPWFKTIVHSSNVELIGNIHKACDAMPEMGHSDHAVS